MSSARDTVAALVVAVGFITAAGCVVQPEPRPAAAGGAPAPEMVFAPSHPPVYMRVLREPPHPRLLEKVHVNFPPDGVALHTAIVSGLPFPVTVSARDEVVDLNARTPVRADGVTVRDYLGQLEGESGYRIELRPGEGIVDVSAIVTRTWHLPALAGMADFNARLGFNEGGDGEEDGEDSERSHVMYSSLTHDDDVWESIVGHAHCILGTGECRRGGQAEPGGDTAALEPGPGSARAGETWLVDNRRLGTISAGGRPQPMARLDRWLSDMTSHSLRLVRLECAILDVAMDERYAMGIDFDAVFGSDGDFFRITHDPEDDGGSYWTLGTVLDSGRFDLDFFIRRLAHHTDVTVKSRARLVVTNAATAYLNTGEVFSYLSGIRSVATEGVATTSFEQSRLQIGLELAVTPRVLDDSGRMLVEVVPILSSVVRFDRLGDSDNRVDTPVIALRQMSSQAITRSGRPVVIGGLTLDRLASDSKTPFSGTWLDRWLASRDRESESRQLLIVITPWEVEV